MYFQNFEIKDIKSLIAFKKVGNKRQNHHLYGIDKGMLWEKPIGD